jgi:hypothetical protein
VKSKIIEIQEEIQEELWLLTSLSYKKV